MTKYYTMQNNDINKIIELFKDGKSKSYNTRVDVLDCNVSPIRGNCNYLTFDEVLEEFSDNCFVHFIYYEGGGLELFLRTMSKYAPRQTDYFLFVYMNNGQLNYFIEKYNLIERV